VLTTDQKGALAEAMILAEALKNGVGVSRPTGDERYDLIFDLRPKLLRVQCKWATRSGSVVVVRCRTNRRGRDGFIHGRYRPGEIDAVAAYCLELDRCYLLPVALSVQRTSVHLRLEQCRNNQLAGVKWAPDFELGATLQQLKGP